MKRIATPKQLRTWAMTEANIPPWLFEECIVAAGSVSAAVALVIGHPNSSDAVPQHQLEAAIASVANASLDERRQFVTTQWQKLPLRQRIAFTRQCFGAQRVAPQAANTPWVELPNALTLRCVLLHAHMGDKRIEAFTVGLWHKEELIPLVRLTRDQHREIDAVALDTFVLNNTVERAGPVRAVAPHVVMEILVDAVRSAPRRKCGLVVRQAAYVQTLHEVHPSTASTLADIAYFMTE